MMCAAPEFQYMTIGDVTVLCVCMTDDDGGLFLTTNKWPRCSRKRMDRNVMIYSATSQNYGKLHLKPKRIAGEELFVLSVCKP